MLPLMPSVLLAPCRHTRPFSGNWRSARRGRLYCRAIHLPEQHRWTKALQLSTWKLKNLQNFQQLGQRLTNFGLAIVLVLGIFAHPAPAVTNEQLLFLEAWRAVDRAYYDKNFNGKPWFKIREQFLKEKSFNDRQDTYGIIRSLLAQLDDPFTRFLEPSRYAALKRGTAGSLTGVGLEVGFDIDAGTDSPLVVITPSPGGPADKAGIQPRDAVLAIDGKPTAGMSLYDAGDLLQGPEGSQVTLQIQPQSSETQKNVQLQRQRLTFNPVSSQVCRRVPQEPRDASSDGSPTTDGTVGYIRIATFSKQTTEGVKAALHQLQAEGATRFVLDIRNNGGGLFPAGVEVARMFLDTGDIVLIADSQGVRDSYQATGIAVNSTAPLAVLVNKGTASASEVLAGALRDNGRGKIVGETTFGKGLIQTIVELSDGSGVAVTVARYQTPDGTDINKRGIQPDISIPTGAMPPTSSAGFCKFVAERGSALLFDAEASKAILAAQPPQIDASGEPESVGTLHYEDALRPEMTPPQNGMPAVPSDPPEASQSRE